MPKTEKRAKGGEGGDKGKKEEPAAKKRKLKKPKKIDKAELNSKTDQNEDITAVLKDLGAQERAAGNHWPSVSYFKAANAIKKYPKRIKSAEEAYTIPGVGEAIALKIEELLETGGVRKLEEVKNDPRAKAVAELSKIPGVGATTAGRLFDEHNVRTVQELAARPELVGDGPAKIGVRYAHELARKVPRAEAERYARKAADAIGEADAKAKVDAVGFLRRGEKQGDTIELLLTHPDYKASQHGKPPALLKPAVEALEKAGLVTEHIKMGKLSFEGIGSLPAVSRAASSGSAQGTQKEIKRAEADEERERDRVKKEQEEEDKVKKLHFEIADSDSDSDDDGDENNGPPAAAAAARAKDSAKERRDDADSDAPPAKRAKTEKVKDEGGGGGDEEDGGDDDGSEACNRHVIVHLMPAECREPALLHFTGPRTLDTRLRQVAVDKDLKLSEYGLFEAGDDGKRLDGVKTERDIFKRLGQDYLEPHERMSD